MEISGLRLLSKLLSFWTILRADLFLALFIKKREKRKECLHTNSNATIHFNGGYFLREDNTIKNISRSFMPESARISISIKY